MLFRTLNHGIGHISKYKTISQHINFEKRLWIIKTCVKAGPIAERSKWSDLDCGRGDPGSNLGEGRFFSAFFWDGELSVTRIDGYVANNK